MSAESSKANSAGFVQTMLTNASSMEDLSLKLESSVRNLDATPDDLELLATANSRYRRIEESAVS